MHYELEKVYVIDSGDILNNYNEYNKDIYKNTFRRVLFNSGINLINEFSLLNDIPKVTVKVQEDSGEGLKGYYYDNSSTLYILLENCSRINPMYSFPGFTSNATAQGVVVHEYGHYLTSGKFKPFKESLKSVKKRINEPCITSYCSNTKEWFAEQLKLFITNPELLKLIRPNTYKEFCKYWKPLDKGTYMEVLSEFVDEIPDRILHRLEILKRKAGV